ncbi:eukaryotic rRNA processing protein EBP2-domain-containing protein [Zopfochytrium polystomum]|nr:eukaryotic rRNA processing protein EBP2-domain-containing protein [Zopfochytrium polystomum]
MKRKSANTTIVENGQRKRKVAKHEDEEVPSVSDDIAAFLDSQDVSDLSQVFVAGSAAAKGLLDGAALKPASKSEARRVAKAERKKPQKGEREPKNGESDGELQIVRQDVEAAEDLLDMEEEAELRAYLEIKKAEKKKQKAATHENTADGNGDDSDSVEDEYEENVDTPSQRVFLNDKAGLHAVLSSIRQKGPGKSFPWIEYQDMTSEQNLSPKEVDDDLKREMAFYNQALHSVHGAFKILKEMRIPIHRPADFYAEMIKSDEHMLRIKKKLLEEAQAIERSERAKELREAKKFGKKVQQDKLAERERAKKDDIEKVKLLRKRANSKKNNPDAGDDEFGITLDSGPSKKDQKQKKPAANKKRQAKDAKYGFGGKKRHAKENTTDSTNDLSSFSARKMKGKSGGRKGGLKVQSFGNKATKGGRVAKKPQRPGKSKRQNARRRHQHPSLAIQNRTSGLICSFSGCGGLFRRSSGEVVESRWDDRVWTSFSVAVLPTRAVMRARAVMGPPRPESQQDRQTHHHLRRGRRQNLPLGRISLFPHSSRRQSWHTCSFPPPLRRYPIMFAQPSCRLSLRWLH